MCPLNSYRRELFAQALARGRSATAAYGEAGYKAGHQGSPSRLKRKPEVQARVAELLEQGAPNGQVTKALIVYDLMRLARKAEALDTPAGIDAARAALVAVAKLGVAMPRPPNPGLSGCGRFPTKMWMAKYGPGSEFFISQGY